MIYDCIVIGAGSAGCTAAATLAKFGMKTALVEKAPRIGPLLRRYRRKGFFCDPGFHYTGGLTPGQGLDRVYDFLGFRDPLVLDPLDADAFDVLSVSGSDAGGDRELRIPLGYDRVVETLSEAYPKSRSAFRALFDFVGGVYREDPFLNFDRKEFVPVTEPAYALSLRQFWTEAGGEEEPLRVLGAHVHQLCGSGAETIPMSQYAYIMGGFYRDASRIARGGDALVEAYEAGLSALGVDLYTGKAAVGILAAEKTFAGVELADGRVLEGQSGIAAVHPAIVEALVPADQIRRVFSKRLAKRVDTESSYAAFFAPDPGMEGVRGRNWYGVNPNTGRVDLGIMGLSASGTDEALAVLKFADPADRGTPAEKAGIRDGLVRDLKRRFPDLSAEPELLDLASPGAYERYTGTPGGAMYGLRQEAGVVRFSSTVPLRGLGVVGQSVIPGVFGASYSGMLGAAQLIGQEVLWQETKQRS